MSGRIRQLKPDFLLDEEFWALKCAHPDLHLHEAFEGLWMHADREGRFEWRPQNLKAKILPYWEGDFSRVLEVLADAGCVVSYVVDGRRYGLVRGFAKHQRPNNREPASIIPPPPDDLQSSVSVHVHARADESPRASLPPLPTPNTQHPTPTRSSGVRPVPGLVVVAAPSRVLTMPGPEPPPEYLDEALMAGVDRVQATSTWRHYHGAGLPERGVEKLHAWLVQRARERANQLARAPARASPGARPEPECEWDWRYLGQHHVSFGERHELDARAIAHRWYLTGAAKGLSASEADRAFATHLKGQARKAKPPPKRPSEPPPKEASA